MKVLHVIPSVALVRGGPSQAVLQMVKAQREAGIDAEIVTTNDDGPTLLEIECNKLIDYKNVPVRFFERYSPNIHALREFAYSKSFTVWLKGAVHKYDVLHIHALFSYPSTVAMRIARQHNVPYILRPIGQLQPWSLAQSRVRKSLFLSLIERKNIRHAAAIHCTSEIEAEAALSLEPTSQTIVIPLGLDQQAKIEHPQDLLRSKYNIEANTPILLFLSRLHPKKDIETLLEALASLESQSNDSQPFHLLVAGDGDSDYTTQLKQLSQQLGLNESVSFIGFAKGEHKQALLQGSDLFVLPSKSENFGIVVLEALNAELPCIISTEVGLANAIQQHNAGFVIKPTVTAFRNCIEEALGNPEKCNLVSQNAKALVNKEYNWKAVIAKLIKLYQQTASAKQRD